MGQGHLSSDKVSNHPCPSSVGLQRVVLGVLILSDRYKLHIIQIVVLHQAFIRPLISTCIILDWLKMISSQLVLEWNSRGYIFGFRPSSSATNYKLEWHPSKRSCLLVAKVIGQEQRVVEIHSKRMKIPIHSKQGVHSHLKHLLRSSLKPAGHLL